MNTLQLERFEGIAKFLRGLVKIVWVLTLVFAAISAAIAITGLFLPTDVIQRLLDLLKESNLILFSAGNFSFHINDLVFSATKFKWVIIAGFMLLVLTLIAGAYVLYQLTRILENVVAKTPFSEQTITATKKMSIAIILCSLLESIGFFSISTLLLRFALIKGTASPSWMNLDFELDLTMIIVAMMVFLLAKIFEYGASLQREADELF